MVWGEVGGEGGWDSGGSGLICAISLLYRMLLTLMTAIGSKFSVDFLL